jgi:hypothetical protein
MSFGKRLKSLGRRFVGKSSSGGGGGTQKYRTPYGTLTYSGNQAVFKPKYTAAQQAGMQTADAGMADLLNKLTQAQQPNSEYNQLLAELNQPFDIDNYYNNPFKQKTYDLLKNTIMQQNDFERQNLSNELNATNQLGSSYAALKEHQLNLAKNQSLNQAELDALKTSAQAYNDMQAQNNERVKIFQQHYGNLLSQLSSYQAYYQTLQNQGNNISALFNKR